LQTGEHSNLKYATGSSQELHRLPNYIPDFFYKIICSRQAEATQQELKAGGQGPKTEQELRRAAQSFLRAGALRRYCEVLVRLGEWDKALSVAPGVSFAYWTQLNQK